MRSTLTSSNAHGSKIENSTTYGSRTGINGEIKKEPLKRQETTKKFDLWIVIMNILCSDWNTTFHSGLRLGIRFCLVRVHMFYLI